MLTHLRRLERRRLKRRLKTAFAAYNFPSIFTDLNRKIFVLSVPEERGRERGEGTGSAPDAQYIVIRELFFYKRALNHEMTRRMHMALFKAAFDKQISCIFQHFGAAANHDAILLDI